MTKEIQKSWLKRVKMRSLSLKHDRSLRIEWLSVILQWCPQSKSAEFQWSFSENLWRFHQEDKPLWILYEWLLFSRWGCKNKQSRKWANIQVKTNLLKMKNQISTQCIHVFLRSLKLKTNRETKWLKEDCQWMIFSSFKI